MNYEDAKSKGGVPAIWVGGERHCGNYPTLVAGMPGIYIFDAEEYGSMFYPAAWRYRYGVYAAAQNVVSGELLVALKDRPENPFVDNKIFKDQQALVWKDPDSASLYFVKTPRGLIEMEDRQVIAVFGRKAKSLVEQAYAQNKGGVKALPC